MVHLLVPPQTELIEKGFVALITGERLLPLVPVHVFRVLSLVAKSLAALHAQERLVVRYQVLLQKRFRSEMLVAYVAPHGVLRLFVRGQVVLQTGRVRQHFAAVLAGHRVRSRMTSRVPVQRVLAGTAFPTH